MTAPVQIGPLVGMNNRLPPDKLQRSQQEGGGQFVSSAVNVDFTGANTMRRRPGSALALTGADCHSFWTDGKVGFMVDDDTLYRVIDAGGALERTAIAAVTPGLQFSYAAVPGGYYASNGMQRLRIEDGVAAEWGVPTPAVAPMLTGEVGGSLPPGRYQVVISFTDAAGEEGGTSIPQVVDVPENGRVVVSDIEQRPGFTTTVYMTACNGDTFYRAGTAALSWLVIPVLNTQGYRPIGLLCTQTPAGHIVRHLNGRLLVAAGNVLYYSEPYHLGLINPARNYIQFPEPVTMVEPCQNGFYLSADQTYWIDGEVSRADLNPVLPYRAVLGTSSQVPNDNKVWWMSERGLVIGDQNGQVANAQEKHVAVQPAAAGASLFREQDGMKQMISTLFGPQSSVMAARSWMDAEIIRKETIL